MPLTNINVLFHDDLDRLSPVHWDYTSSKVSPSGNGQVEIVGKSEWNSSMNWKQALRETGGVVVLFQYDGSAEFELYLDRGEWQKPDYRRWGIYAGTDLKMNIWKGGAGPGGNPLRGNLTPRPNTWYYLLLAIGKDEEFLARIWEQNDPTRQVEYRQQFGDDWTGKDWGFAITANSGKVYVDAFTAISFEDIR